MTMELTLIFPNQLFENSELLQASKKVMLIEENLFFKHFNFHKQKILFHRMSMKCYEKFLKAQYDTDYIDSTQTESDIRILIKKMSDDIQKINIYDPNDNWLQKRIKSACSKKILSLRFIITPYFCLTKQI